MTPALPSPSPDGVAKLVSMDVLVSQRERWRQEGKVVVWTNGCFDVLHVGHLHSLEAARRLGHVLVVGLNDDASVCALKGSGRPFVPAAERATLIAALEVVTRAVIFSGLTPERPLARLQPDIHCKGADYAPPRGLPIPEMATVEGYGGRVEFLPLVPERSTSSLMGRVRASLSP